MNVMCVKPTNENQRGKIWWEAIKQKDRTRELVKLIYIYAFGTFTLKEGLETLYVYVLDIGISQVSSHSHNATRFFLIKFAIIYLQNYC